MVIAAGALLGAQAHAADEFDLKIFHVNDSHSYVEPVNTFLTIDNDKGVATCKTDFFLYRTVEWRMAAFFRAIGQKKHGEKLVMDWTKVPGATGRVKLKPRKYKKDDGTEGTTNNIDKYLDYDADKMMIADEPVEGDLPWGDEA